MNKSGVLFGCTHDSARSRGGWARSHRQTTESKEKIMMDWPYFEALPSEAQGVPVLRISGDIILGTVPRFRAALEEAVDAVKRTEGSEHVLVVDLRETEFMDSVGLATLIGSTRELRARGGEARLVVQSGPVMRILEVTGISEEFRIYPDVLSATEELQAGA
jgi:anti-anti-sigma factor